MRGYDIPYVWFPGVSENNRYEQAFQLRDYAAEQVLEEQIGSVKIIYPRAVSFVVQKVHIEKVLPFSRIPKSSAATVGMGGDTILESTVGGIIEYLLFLYLGQNIFEILGWSRLA